MQLQMLKGAEVKPKTKMQSKLRTSMAGDIARIRTCETYYHGYGNGGASGSERAKEDQCVIMKSGSNNGTHPARIGQMEDR